MTIKSIKIILWSNGLFNKKDASILYSIIGITIIVYCIPFSFASFFFTYLNKGLALYGGLFNASTVSHNFHILILMVSMIILQLTGFLPRKSRDLRIAFCDLLQGKTHKNTKEIIANSTGKIFEQFSIIEYLFLSLFLFYEYLTEIQNLFSILKDPYKFLLSILIAYAFKVFIDIYKCLYSKQIVILTISALILYSCSPWLSNYSLILLSTLLIGLIFIHGGHLLINLGKKTSNKYLSFFYKFIGFILILLGIYFVLTAIFYICIHIWDQVLILINKSQPKSSENSDKGNRRNPPSNPPPPNNNNNSTGNPFDDLRKQEREKKRKQEETEEKIEQEEREEKIEQKEREKKRKQEEREENIKQKERETEEKRKQKEIDQEFRRKQKEADQEFRRKQKEDNDKADQIRKQNRIDWEADKRADKLRETRRKREAEEELWREYEEAGEIKKK